jgi:hypothetical protein
MCYSVTKETETLCIDITNIAASAGLKSADITVHSEEDSGGLAGGDLAGGRRECWLRATFA